jgi:hypothetical protein
VEGSMGNAIALVVQPIAKALSLNAHSDENLIKAIAAGDEGANADSIRTP